MGLFGKKKEEKPAQNKAEQRMEERPAEKQPSEKQPEEKKEQKEMKVYIRGAGGTIVTKSILNGTSKLKWLFRQESEHGNGWVAFGDSQEYVDDAKNMAIVDFNTLANIEPTVVNAFYMPVGSDLGMGASRPERKLFEHLSGDSLIAVSGPGMVYLIQVFL